MLMTVCFKAKIFLLTQHLDYTVSTSASDTSYGRSSKKTEAAKSVLNGIPVKPFTDIFLEMYSLHLGKKDYNFTQAAWKVIQSIETEFITELNEAITQGIPSPKSKRTDLVKRRAVSLHFLHTSLAILLKEESHGFLLKR